MRAVAFDFDGTLTTTDTTKFLMAALLRSRPQRLASFAWVVLRRVLRLMEPQEFKSAGLRFLLQRRQLHGVSLAMPHYAASVRRKLRLGMVRKLEEHVASGDLVILATASPAFAVSQVFAGQSIEIIGAEFEVVQGRYTGVCLSNCYGPEKALRVTTFLESRGFDSLEYAYGDHLPCWILQDMEFSSIRMTGQNTCSQIGDTP